MAASTDTAAHTAGACAGLPADLREMRALADRYGFRLLEDASHATGASYQGQPVGRVGVSGTFSSRVRLWAVIPSQRASRKSK